MPINPDYLSSLTEQIEGCADCEELQAQVDKVMGAINEQLAAVNKQIEALAPVLACLELPTDPMAILGWASAIVDNIVKPMTAPILEYQAQLVQLTQTVSEIQALIPTLSAKFPECSVSVPLPSPPQVGGV